MAAPKPDWEAEAAAVYAAEWGALEAMVAPETPLALLAACTTAAAFCAYGYVTSDASFRDGFTVEYRGTASGWPATVEAGTIRGENTLTFIFDDFCVMHRYSSTRPRHDDAQGWKLIRDGRSRRGPPTIVTKMSITWKDELGKLHNLFGPSQWSNIAWMITYHIRGVHYSTVDEYNTACDLFLTENPNVAFEAGRSTKGASS